MKTYTDKRGREWHNDGEDFWLCDVDGLQVEEYLTAKNESVWLSFDPGRGVTARRATAEAAMDAAGGEP